MRPFLSATSSLSSCSWTSFPGIKGVKTSGSFVMLMLPLMPCLGGRDQLVHSSSTSGEGLSESEAINTRLQENLKSKNEGSKKD